MNENRKDNNESIEFKAQTISPLATSCTCDRSCEAHLIERPVKHRA